MKKFKLTINGNQYDVDIVAVEDNVAEVDVNGTRYQVEVDKQIQTTKTPRLVRATVAPSTDVVPSVAKTSSPTSAKGVGTIKSPLPGIVLKVCVNEGDVVKIGDKLIVLEAMKMENNINSDKEGRIVTIKTKKGDSVLEGDLLIQIEG